MIFIFFLFRLQVPFLDLFGPKIKGKYVIKDVCPDFNDLRIDAANSLGKLNFISTAYQTFKNSVLQNIY